jgi:hypothetical protein
MNYKEYKEYSTLTIHTTNGEASTSSMRRPNIYTNKIYFKINILTLIYKIKIQNNFNNIKC